MHKAITEIVNGIKRAAEDCSKDLAGIAANEAIKVLTDNWETATGEGHGQFVDTDKARVTMLDDLDGAIEILTHLRLGLQTGAMAQVNMRRALGLDYELPSFDLCDEQLEWVGRIRELYPAIGPKEAFRLAAQEYATEDGVLPPSTQD